MRVGMKVLVSAAVVVIAASAGAGAAAVASTDHGRSVAKVVFKPAVASDPQTTPEMHFVPLAPCRIIDTRKAHALRSGKAQSFVVVGSSGFSGQGGKACGVPAGASAIAANVVAVGPSAAGYLIGWASGRAKPASSFLDYAKHATVSTGTILPINGPQNRLSLQAEHATANAVVDVTGYYVAQIQGLIESDGSLSSGTSRIVSVSHPGTGFYYVTLDRPARQCTPTAITYNLDHYAAVGLSSSSTPNVISVTVWSLDATTHREMPIDFPFFLTVTC